MEMQGRLILSQLKRFLLTVQTYNLPKSWHFLLYVLAITITSRTCTSHCHHQQNMYQSLPSLVEHVLVIAITSSRRTCTGHCHYQQNMYQSLPSLVEHDNDDHDLCRGNYRPSITVTVIDVRSIRFSRIHQREMRTLSHVP